MVLSLTYDACETLPPEGSDARSVGKSTSWKQTVYVFEITKKTLKPHIIGIIITSKDSLSVKIRNLENHKNYASMDK